MTEQQDSNVRVGTAACEMQRIPFHQVPCLWVCSGMQQLLHDQWPCMHASQRKR